jgi:hypothetical protein
MPIRVVYLHFPVLNLPGTHQNKEGSFSEQQWNLKEISWKLTRVLTKFNVLVLCQFSCEVWNSSKCHLNIQDDGPVLWRRVAWQVNRRNLSKYPVRHTTLRHIPEDRKRNIHRRKNPYLLWKCSSYLDRKYSPLLGLLERKVALYFKNKKVNALRKLRF